MKMQSLFFTDDYLQVVFKGLAPSIQLTAVSTFWNLHTPKLPLIISLE